MNDVAGTRQPELECKSDNPQSIEVRNMSNILSNIHLGSTDNIPQLAGARTHLVGGSHRSSRHLNDKISAHRKTVSFPNEIFDLILGEVNLRNNRLKILRSLAIVSHTFLSICRRLLFRDIRVTFAPDESLVEYELILKQFVEFTAFLISHPELLGVVRKLVLVNAWGGKLRLPCPSYAMTSANLIQILSKLRCLTVLEVSSNAMVPLDWRYFDSNVKNTMTDALQRTQCKQISLANVQGICETDMSHILMFCKNLELNACILLPSPTPAVSLLCTPLITSTFSLKLSDTLDTQKVACFPSRLLMGLSSLILIPRIGKIEPFLDISRAARHTLVNLEWQLGYGMSGKSFSYFLPCTTLSKRALSLAFANVIDLGIFPNLCSFAIRCSKYGEKLEGLSDLLRSVAIDNEIDTITIIMAPVTELGLYHFLNDFRWEVLDGLLRDEKFRNLRRFVLRLQWIKGLANFKLEGRSSEEGILETLKRRLPGLSETMISISHDAGLV